MYLLENITFFSSNDSDEPGNKQLIKFDSLPYELEGDTHGKKSHAIKHLIEFKPDAVNHFLDEAIDAIKDSANINIIRIKTGEVIDSGSSAFKMITREAMLNTFDYVNDKVQLKHELTPEDKIILEIIWKMTTNYVQMLESDISDAIDVDTISNPDELSQLLANAKVIKFTGNRRGSHCNYYLDLSDTGLIAEKQGMIATMFRIDKKGNDMRKVAKYFESAAQVSNPILMSTLKQMDNFSKSVQDQANQQISENYIRKFVRACMFESSSRQILYTGIVLDANDVAQLKSKIFELRLSNNISDWEFSNIAAHGNEQLNHHMTLTPGELSQTSPLQDLMNSKIPILVTGWGYDDELGVAAWRVETPPDSGIITKSGNPHITAALRYPTIKPFLAAKINNWMPIPGGPFEIIGRLKSVQSIAS